MLIFNLNRLAKLRGIKSISEELQKNGFSRFTAYDYVYQKIKHIKPEHLEKLCIIFNCTPDELFDWKPDNSSVHYKGLALEKLRNKESFDITAVSRDLPVEKLEDILNLYNEIRAEEK